MRVILQRVSEASVSIAGEVHGKIARGLLVLVGIENEDDQTDIDWLSKKIVNLRIFSDGEGRMNQSLLEVKGQLLVISQFTLHAKTKKGNRPSYIKAARPEVAIPLYERFVEALNQLTDSPVEVGVFGADMQVQLINDGPVTISIDTKDKA